jgi:glycosyltransferase involved in cell wall biosynthesis
LGDLLADPERADALGRAGRAAIHSRFSAQSMAEETLRLYRRMTSRSGVSTPG